MVTSRMNPSLARARATSYLLLYTHLVEHLGKWFLVVHQSAKTTWKKDGANSSSHCPNTLFFLRKMKWRRMHLYIRDVNDDSLATSEGTSENLFSASSPVARQTPFTPFFFCTHLIFMKKIYIYKYLLRKNLVHNRQ